MKNKLNFLIRHTSKEGVIGVIINNVKYTYFLDGGFIPKIERIKRYAPGKALTFLKAVADSYIKE